MTEPTPKFIVFNYVTSKIEQSENEPEFGDPNAGVQTSALAAYGNSAGGQALSSGVVAGPTPATLGNPAAAALAQAKALLAPELAGTVEQALGSLGQLGQLPAAMGQMKAQASRVLDNATQVFDAIDTIFRPEEAGQPNRCQSIGDFIGSVQGTLNSAIEAATSGLNAITNALISVPMALINSVVDTINGLVSAITSQISSAINTAVAAVTDQINSFFDSVGSQLKSLFDGVGKQITQIQDAINREINNLNAAINQLLNNPFRLVLPNVSPCLQSILGTANVDFQIIRPLPNVDLTI
jgi:phage-related protein